MTQYAYMVEALEVSEKLASFGFWRGKRVATDSVKKRVKWHGIQLLVDRPKGFTMEGTDSSGNKWTRTYQVDYGYIPKTDGGDGEGLDVFIGPDTSADTVWWVTQKKDDGSFDEYKLLVNFKSKEAALKCYKAHVPAKYFAGVGAFSVGIIQALLGKRG